jgi:hypothetical protein
MLLLRRAARLPQGRIDQVVTRCDVCDQPAVWVRRTQFAGNHPFCDRHARAEADFGQEDDSYFFWEEFPSRDSEGDDEDDGDDLEDDALAD